MQTLDIVAVARKTLLPQSEAEFRRLLEKLPAGAYTCNADGLITYYNQRAVDLWGRAPKLNDPADRFCGSFKLYAADGTPISHDACWMALALKHRQEYNGREIVVERPDGARLTALAHANPICDSDGELLGAVNVLVDISDRKAAEEALRIVSRYKDEFLATLAHELRNPLAPMRNALHMLKLKMPACPESTNAVAVLERQLRQMTRLIDDLMDIARITRNRLDLKRERVSLTDVLHVALETSQPSIEAGGHRFSLYMPGERIMIEADATRIAQVVSNLLNNAAKFTPRGGLITLRAERDDRHAVLRVIDTGMGISAEALPRIFEMFAQADQSIERKHAGLGVGLTLAQRLVELHGGKLEAKSEGANRGSEFIIRLPLAESVADTAGMKRRGSPGESRAAPLRILVVDDNVDSAATMAALLSMYGHEVEVAHDGIDALEHVQHAVPDVALLDIGMPKMNGYTLAQRIRERADGCQPLLIAVTGWGQEDDRQRSKAAGFDHHLVKPVEPPQLLQLLSARQRA